MKLPEQIQFIEALEATHTGETRQSLAEVKESLKHLHGIYTDIALKYPLFEQFVGVYFNFMISRVPLFVFSKVDGKNLKEIIAKLMKVNGGATEAKALEMWEYIFHHWARLSPFMGQKRKLSEINANLVEIIDQLKNGHYANKSTEQANTANAQQIINDRKQRRANGSSDK